MVTGVRQPCSKLTRSPRHVVVRDRDHSLVGVPSTHPGGQGKFPKVSFTLSPSSLSRSWVALKVIVLLVSSAAVEGDVWRARRSSRSWTPHPGRPVVIGMMTVRLGIGAQGDRDRLRASLDYRVVSLLEAHVTTGTSSSVILTTASSVVPALTPVGRVFPKVTASRSPVVVVLVLGGAEGDVHLGVVCVEGPLRARRCSRSSTPRPGRYW